MSLRDFHWAALSEFDAYKAKFFDAVEKGYRSEEVKNLQMHGVNDDTIFISHLLGVYKANKEMGLTK